jgi:glycosyltransferase involved in cell wall biosynthesis
MTDGVLVLSSAEAQNIARFNPRVPVHVVANAFRPSESGPGERAEHVPDAEPLRFLFVGRLIEEKGIFEMLSAFAAVSARHKCRLVLVGDGPRAADVTRRIAELGLTEKVTVKGFLTGDQLGATYRNADVFVFPSYSEGFPTVIAEALHAGLPIVTTRIRGMADHLVEGRNALFVAPREVDRLAGALERLVLDAELRHRMGTSNREKVADFAPSVVAAQYLDALAEIVRNPRPTVATR